MMIEGFYFRLKDDTIFYVKGVIHPPGKVVGYPKYVPSPNGDRVDERGVRYVKKEGLEDEILIVKQRYPQLLVNDQYVGGAVPEVPYDLIAEVYDPVVKARRILLEEIEDEVVTDVKNMVIDIAENTNVKNVGVSGSVLVGLHTLRSDIDIVIYGVNEGRKVYEYLKDVINKPNSPYRRYSREDIYRLYSFRSLETPISIEELLKQERRRVLEGYFKGREYFMRLIKPPTANEMYGKVRYSTIGKATLKLKVVDASESIYTPCRYRVETIEFLDGVKVYVDEVYSLRGRFNELAVEDDVIIVRGTIEKLMYSNGKVRFRLYLGYPGDYLLNTSHS